MHKSSLSKLKNINMWLYNQNKKELLRFLTCGNVDDGKSTLIGRLLYDTNQIYDDHLLSLKKVSKKHGTQGQNIDLALLTDGLQAEIEQGITIDVAYRYFSTENRKFIIADTPGHQQYTRNMATGASTSDLAILLIDARKGMLSQTRMHSFICTLLGIRYLLIAINKMDLMDYKKEIFYQIQEEFLKFSKKLPSNTTIDFIPISALTGENVVTESKHMNTWYKGLTILKFLEKIDIHKKNKEKMRFPIQYINRPNFNFRGYSGTLVSGKLCVGKKIKVLPSGMSSTIHRILTFDGDLKTAVSGQAITVVLKDDIDVSRGDIFINFDDTLSTAQKISLDIVWMGKDPIKIGQKYKIKICGKKVLAHIDNIQYQIDMNHLGEYKKVDHLPLNGIGVIDITVNEKIIVDKYFDNKITGSMIFIDCINNLTVGAGMVKSMSNIQSKKDMFQNFEKELKSLIQRYFPH